MGLSKPKIISIKVVLPEPVVPTIPTVEFGYISRSKSLSTGISEPSISKI